MNSNRPTLDRNSGFLSVVAFILIFVTGTAFGESNDLIPTIEKIESELHARVGVSVKLINSGQRWEYNADHRFPMSSTFKTIACAALLHRVDAGEEQLNRTVRFEEEDLVSYSPVTESRIGPVGMSFSELCQATITVSDNTAGNLVLEAIGGPGAVTDFARSIGDEVTQLNRWETELNEALPGDTRDTTTPNAMAYLIEQLLFGEVLSLDSRARLQSWLEGNIVGDELLRAGIPEDWAIGDKTGAGGYGSRSIAAVMWPPSSNPIITTIYITETDASFEDRNKAIAEIGRAIANAVKK